MSRIQVIKSTTEKVDKALVDRFATMTPSVVERPLDDGRVDYLTTRIAEGNAIPFNWAFATFDGVDYRMNGQHSSTALAKLNGNLPDDLIAHIDQYKVDSKAELVNIFRQFDVRKSGRSPLDVANAYASVVDELNGIPRDILKLGAEGINWSHQMVDRLPARKSDDRYSALMEPQNLQFLQWMGGVFSIKTPELRALPVVAAMYKTYFIDPEVADKFWSAVSRGGDEYNDQDPAHALDKWLERVKSDKLDMRPAQLYQACIFAWNAYVDGKLVTKIVHDIKKGLHDPKYPA